MPCSTIRCEAGSGSGSVTACSCSVVCVSPAVLFCGSDWSSVACILRILSFGGILALLRSALPWTAPPSTEPFRCELRQRHLGAVAADAAAGGGDKHPAFGARQVCAGRGLVELGGPRP